MLLGRTPPNQARIGSRHVTNVVAFVQATLGIVFNSAEFAAIPSLVQMDDLVAANGRVQASYSAAQVLGPVLGGVLVLLVRF